MQKAFLRYLTMVTESYGWSFSRNPTWFGVSPILTSCVHPWLDRARQTNLISNYTITWLLCVVLLVVDHTQIGEIASDPPHPRQITSADLFFFFHAPKNTSKNHLNFCCIKQIDNIFPCVCTEINRRWQRLKNKKYDTRRTRVAWLLFFTRSMTFSVIYYSTHARRNLIYLFYTIKIQMHGLLKVDVDLTSFVCVALLYK